MCGGSGELICSRCKGTGFYQTYIEYTAHYCVRQYCNPGPTPDFMEGLRVATGEELCHIVAKYWKKDNIVQFDNTEKAFEDLISKSGMYAKYAEKFKNDYTQISENEQSINGYQPYMNILRANKIPYAKVRYSINNEEYEMIFLGNSGVVCYIDVPKTIKIFELSPEEKEYLERTKYKRHKAIAALTAYLINLGNKKPTVSLRGLNLILQHMCMDTNARHRKIKYLMQRYSADIYPEIMLDNVKCLLYSKKTISYVWHIISCDGTPSDSQLDFFDRLTKRYSISENEVNTLKRFAEKMSNLDSFAEEYLDSGPVYHDTVYWSVLAITAALLIPSVTLLFVSTVGNVDAFTWGFWLTLIFGALAYKFALPILRNKVSAADAYNSIVTNEHNLSTNEFLTDCCYPDAAKDILLKADNNAKELNNDKPKLKIQNIHLNPNIYYDGSFTKEYPKEFGIGIVCDLQIDNLQDIPLSIALHFFWAEKGGYKSEGIIVDENSGVWTSDGKHLAVYDDIPVPDSQSYIISGFRLFIPYSQVTSNGLPGIYKIQSIYTVADRTDDNWENVAQDAGPNIEINVSELSDGVQYTVKQIPIKRQ